MFFKEKNAIKIRVKNIFWFTFDEIFFHISDDSNKKKISIFIALGGSNNKLKTNYTNIILTNLLQSRKYFDNIAEIVEIMEHIKLIHRIFLAIKMI